ncbi:T9SS type A sorting domain-containing protein [Psychroserpens sp. Hel_I_66]|uniref:T9SS type A sorting domain-containing protein n=1 Tax=Psychroserpens sp. Hel_I_66 TaxID=1250004 RepID=UPI0006475AA6|nr:T9SS type A sorting domain-containing protein [Psychroserpens sp. Hel_I_66]
MKKITLLFLMFLAFTFGNAQETISFEAPAYTLGDINAQNGWFVTGCGVGCFISNQVVSSEQSTDGTASLKIAPDPAFGNTFGAIFGGFYDFALPIDFTDATFSYDVRITQQDANSSDFRFGVTGEDAMGDLFFTFLIDFDFEGNIKIADATGAFQNVGTWSVDTWYNVRAETTGSNIVYFVDDVQVGTSILLNDFDFTGLRFVHDNFGGEGYLDNLRINDEDLSVSEFSINSFTHFYNTESKELKLNSPQNNLSTLEIYDVLGKNIFNQNLNGNEDSVELSQLKNGIYLARVSTENGIKTLKFIKS